MTNQNWAVPNTENGALSAWLDPVLRKYIIVNLQVLVALAYLQLAARYKATRLGFMWSFIKPAVQFAFFFIIFGFFLKVQNEPIGQYALKLYLGLACWWFWAEATSYAIASLYANTNFVVHIKIPLAMMPVASMIAAWINHLVVMLVFLTAYVFAPSRLFHVEMIGFAVLGYCLLLLLVFGVGLVLSYVAVIYKDLIQIWELVLFYLIFFCPIVYTPSIPDGYLFHYHILVPLALPLELIKAPFFGLLLKGDIVFELVLINLAQLLLIWIASLLLIAKAEGKVRDLS